jgi:2-C-methyl-D-erythritol 4-phosphate cytidylyltransferase
MGSAVPKQFLALDGVPILVHALRVLEAVPAIHEIILAIPEPDREYCLRHVIEPHGLKKVTKIVAGGARRQDSVRHALEAVSAGTELVLVHDAVRPFLTAAMVVQALEQAAKHGAAIVAVPMRDTVKQAGAGGLIVKTIDRGSLWLAQTPQAFRRALLLEAHRKAELDGVHATDDAQLVERLGQTVAIVEGSPENIKITRPEDLAMGEAILASRSKR